MKFRREKDIDLDDVSILSEGMEIIGNINTKGSLRLDGKVNGDISAGGNVTIGQHGIVKGNITAKSITIGGKVAGSVQVTEKIFLESKSKLFGNLTGRILVIEEGAVFNGESDMKETEPKPVNAVPVPKTEA